MWLLLLLARHIESTPMEVIVLKICLALQTIELLVLKSRQRVYLEQRTLAPLVHFNR